MINQTLWAGLSVQTFFNGYNWGGEPPKLEAKSNDLEDSSKINWFKLDLSSFLARSNWRGETSTVISSAESVSCNPILSLTLPVNTFLQSIRWQGNGKVSAIKPTPRSPSSSLGNIDLSMDDEWKVDDLSDLL